jgi:hypothetical protein
VDDGEGKRMAGAQTVIANGEHARLRLGFQCPARPEPCMNEHVIPKADVQFQGLEKPYMFLRQSRS